MQPSVSSFSMDHSVKVQEIIKISLLRIDKLLTRDLFSLQDDLAKEIKTQEQRMTLMDGHKHEAFEKIDCFFEDVKLQIEKRKD